MTPTRARALAEEGAGAGAADAQSNDRGVRRGTSSASCSRVQGELDDAQACTRGERADSARARKPPQRRVLDAGLWPASPSSVGNYPRARELFEQSLAILRSLDDAWGVLGSLSGLALVALEEHDNRSARRLLERERRAPAVRAATTIERRTASRPLRRLAAAEAPRPPRRSPVRERQASLADRWALECSSARPGPTPPRTSPGSAPRSATKRSPKPGRRDAR